MVYVQPSRDTEDAAVACIQNLVAGPIIVVMWRYMGSVIGSMILTACRTPIMHVLCTFPPVPGDSFYVPAMLHWDLHQVGNLLFAI